MTNKVKIAVVYHSRYGHTEVQAKHILEGAQSVSATEVILLKVEDLISDPSALNVYDALIFGCPTYMGSVSAKFKEFMEASSKLWGQQAWKDKIAAGFTNSYNLNGDKFNTLIDLFTFSAQHGMNWVSLGLLNESGTDVLPMGDGKAVNRLGAYIGAMAQSNNAPASVTPPSGDLKTAELLGKRVSEATQRWVSR